MSLNNLCAIDFETYPINKDAVYPKPVCVSTFDSRGAFLYAGQDIEKVLRELLSSRIIIAHNATFECGVIYHNYPDLRSLLFTALEENRIRCTMINEQLLSITREKGRFSFDLASLVNDYFKEDISSTKGEDSWRLRYNELEGIPLDKWPKEAKDYAINDSIWAYKIYEKQDKLEFSLALLSSVYLNLMGSKGLNIDLNRVKALKEEILVFLNPKHQYLIDKGFCERDKNSEYPKKKLKKLKEYIETLGVEYMYAPKGGVSLTGEALEYYNNQVEDEIVKTFLDISKYEKVLTAFISHLQETPVFSQYSTTKNTGRTSCRGSSLFPSLNIQQMPREVPGVKHDIRNCFVPREGFKILSIDYGGLELCSTAHQLYKLYGKSKMRDAINEGSEPTDMHSKLAARIKKISYEEFLSKKKEYKDARQLAKPINLGFPGGIGYDTLRKILWQSGVKTNFKVLHKSKNKNDLVVLKLQLGAPDVRVCRLTSTEYALVQDELVYLKSEFFNLYPELETFLKDSHKKFLTGKSRYVKNEFDEWEEEPMYKYSVYGFTRDWCTYTAFCNGYLMQTPSAIGAKKAVVAICKKYLDHPDVNPLAFIHDEILFEVRESRTDLVDDLAFIMIKEMQSVLSSVRISVEASLMDYWQKGDGFWTKKYWEDNK